jgi:hypothetical protein
MEAGGGQAAGARLMVSAITAMSSSVHVSSDETDSLDCVKSVSRRMAFSS